MDAATKPNKNTRGDMRAIAAWYALGMVAMIAGIFAIIGIGALLGF